MKTSIKKLSDRIFVVDGCIIDFDEPNKLTIEQELHNRRCEFESKLEESRYDFEGSYKRFERRYKIFHQYKDEVNALTPDEKLSYIPKWIEYKINWSKTATKYDKEYGPKAFDVFIACELNPNKVYEFPMVFRLRKGYIKYVSV